MLLRREFIVGGRQSSNVAAGRARLAWQVMNPNAMGSPAGAMTMGMSRVAFFAAMMAGVCEATITSTLKLQNKLRC